MGSRAGLGRWNAWKRTSERQRGARQRNLTARDAGMDVEIRGWIRGQMVGKGYEKHSPLPRRGNPAPWRRTARYLRRYTVPSPW